MNAKQDIEQRLAREASGGASPPVKPTKPRSFLFTALPFFVMAHAGHHFLTALPQALLPFFQTEFNLSVGTAAFVPMAFAIASATGQLPAGWLADKWGPAILIAIGTVGVALGGVFTGFSSSYGMLIVGLILIGLLSGGYHPASTPLISASVEPNQRGRALGIHLVGGNSSFFIAPLIAAGITAIWGWRGAFFTLAVPTAVLGIIFYIYLTRHAGKAHVERARKQVIDDLPPQPGYKRRLIAFLTMMVVGGGAGMSLGAFLPLYMTNELGASDATATALLSIVFSSGLWAGPVGGWISDKVGTVKIIVITGLLSGLLIFGFKYVTLGWSLYIMLFVHGLNMALRMPVTEVFIMSQAPGKHRSKIFGIYYSTMQYTGAIFALPIGFLIEKFGFQTMFTWSAVVVTIVAVVTAFFIWDAKDNYHAQVQAKS